MEIAEFADQQAIKRIRLCGFGIKFFVLKGQFLVSGIFRAGGILDNKMLLNRNNQFNFRVTFSLVNKRISTRSENSTDWKLALKNIKIFRFAAQ